MQAGFALHHVPLHRVPSYELPPKAPAPFTPKALRKLLKSGPEKPLRLQRDDREDRLRREADVQSLLRQLPHLSHGGRDLAIARARYREQMIAIHALAQRERAMSDVLQKQNRKRGGGPASPLGAPPLRLHPDHPDAMKHVPFELKDEGRSLARSLSEAPASDRQYLRDGAAYNRAMGVHKQVSDAEPFIGSDRQLLVL